MQGLRKDDQYKKLGVVGDNGKGKSTVILNLLRESYDLSVHKVLIICQTNPRAYNGITRLNTYEDLRNFQSGMAVFWDYEVEEEVMLCNIAAILNEGQKNRKERPRDYDSHYLHNGAIIFDDASNYLSTTLPKILKQFLGNYRMFFVDLIFIAHTLTDFPAALRRRMNYFILFKTLETLSERDLKAFRYPNYENLHKAWVKVMNSPDNYDKIVIRTGSE